MVYDGYDDTAHWECRYWAMCARQDRHTMEVNIALPSFTSLALAFSFFPANLVLAPNLGTLSATCAVLLLLSRWGHWGFHLVRSTEGVKPSWPKIILTASLIKPDKMNNGSSRLLNISNSYTYPYIHCALPETSTALWILLIYVDDINGKDND